MRTFMTALAAMLVFAFTSSVDARERKRGFSLGSNVFGVFNDSRRARLKRSRRKQARLRASKRRASVRRAKAKRRQAVRRSAGRRVVRRGTARRKVARRTAKRREVARRTVARRTTTRRATARRKKVSRKAANRFNRQTVNYRSKQKPGTIVVDTKTRHLYYVLKGGKAIRYGVAVGKEGFAWSGVSRIRRKVKWPTWTPPSEMIKRKPELAEFASGMPGGPQNPLGARALYLFQGKKDTLYRIHGTNNPASIGRAASSGCIRMRNDDVAHLYARVGMGTKVIVR